MAISIRLQNMRERTGVMVVQLRAFVGWEMKLCTLWSTLSFLNIWIIINFWKKKGSLQQEWFLFNRNGVWQIARYNKAGIQTEIAELLELGVVGTETPWTPHYSTMMEKRRLLCCCVLNRSVKKESERSFEMMQSEQRKIRILARHCHGCLCRGDRANRLS
jgi:hypothetical protein